MTGASVRARVGCACWHTYVGRDDLAGLWQKAAAGIPVRVKTPVRRFP